MRFALLALLLISIAAPAQTKTPAAPAKPAASPDAVRELRWEELIPDGYRPDEIFRRFAKRAGGLKDDDPRAKELQKELLAAWSEAPIVAALDGKKVKLPGYVVPLEGDGKKVREFLLVPYFGACIHVPPPPSNQMVFVNASKTNASIHKQFDTVMVTGVMRTTGFSSELGSAGYTIEAIKVENY